MKILLTTSFYPPYHVGGDAVHVKYLADALAEQGNEVHVMHSLDAYALKGLPSKESESPRRGITIHALHSPLGRLEPILNYSFGTQKYTLDYFRKLVKAENFDVVHHHNISLLGYNILKKLGPYKNLYTAHDYWLICHKYDLMKAGRICESRNCLSCCIKRCKPYQFFRDSTSFREALGDLDAIIAPSRFMAESLKKEFKSVTVINNFISEPPLPQKAQKQGDYFIFAGVVCRNKGIFNLIDAFSRVRKRLLIAGKGDSEAEIKHIIAERKLKNVKMLGWQSQENLFPLITSAQALIIPSIWPENNPLIALESLYLGTPVIGSNWGGIPEIVEKVDRRLIFSSPLQLAEILKTFNRKKYPASKLKKIYGQNFSQKIFFKKYISLIKAAEAR